jgi:hypothetical protein
MRLVWCTALAAAILAGPVSGGADEAPLAGLPSQAPVVVHVRSLERVAARLRTLVQNSGGDTNELLQHVMSLLGPVEGRKFIGLGSDGALALALVELPNLESDLRFSAGLFAQVKDYPAFRDGLLTEKERQSVKAHGDVDKVVINDQDYYFGKRGQFVVFTTDKVLAENYAAGQGKLGLDKELSAEARSRLLGHDVCLYVNLGTVNKQYEHQIAMFRGMMDVGLGQVSELTGMPPGFGDLLKQVLEHLLQGFMDARLLLWSFDFEPVGLRTCLFMEFASKSITSGKLSRMARLQALERLGRLPLGRFAYQGVDYGELWGPLVPLTLGVLPSENQERAKQQTEALQALLAAGPGVMLSAARQQNEAVYLWDFEVPQQAGEALWKLFASLEEGDAYSLLLRLTKVRALAEPVRHRGYEFRHLALEWDLGRLPDDMVEQIKLQYGTGVLAWMGVLDKQWIMVTAKDWEAAKAVIDDLLDRQKTLDQLPYFKDFTRYLPAKASLYSLGHVRYAFLQGFAAGAGLQEPSTEPDRTARPEDWIGAAVTIQPQNFQLDVWFPAKAINETIKETRRQFGQPGGR